MKTITIVAVDDHPLIRKGIKSLVEEREYMELVAEGGVGDDVMPLVEQYQPNVLLLDLSMHQHQKEDDDGTRFQALPTISKLTKQHPQTDIIILTQHYVPVLIRGAINRGVKGYILKSDDLSLNLAGAIETVAIGSVYFSETISKQLFRNGEVGKAAKTNLTERQTQILNAIYNSPDVPYSILAKNLQITESTFKAHLTKAFKALGVTNVTAAMIRCMELEIIHTEIHVSDKEDST